MSTEDILQTFFLECGELLETLNDGLAQIEGGIDGGAVDLETINAIFRAVHSIKGGAGAFGFEALVKFAHQFESVLDEMRSGTLMPASDNIRVFWKSCDHLSDLVNAARDGTPVDAAISADLLGQLAALLGESGEAADAGLSFAPVPLALDLGGPATRRFRIVFRPQDALYASGNDPLHLLREVSLLGDMTVSIDLAAMPPLAELAPKAAYAAWTLELETTAGASDVAEIFDFVEGLCAIEIIDVTPPPDPEGDDTGYAPIPLQLDLGGAEGPPVAPDVSPDAAPEPLAGPVVKSPDPVPPPAPRAGAPTAPAGPPQPATAAGGPAPPAAPLRDIKSTVRVDLGLVDRLINMVGELVINQAVLAQGFMDARVPNADNLSNSLAECQNLTRDIQEGIMAIRTQSIKPLFQRMERIVREASEMAGKDIRFVTEGETTELDRTAIERLADPLTHILRNAVDHGLEPSERRVEAGKPATGVVTLRAGHRSGRVIVEISDDGAGINRPKVRQIAIDKGLIPADQQLTDPEIDQLLFLPGFSTAGKVTNLSGRGVGMDVVRSEIRKLGGRVNIQSTPGAGTTIAISLPLTLAVLDGMVVDVAGHTMVVPISTIGETMRPQHGDIHGIGLQGQVVCVRDTFVPIIDLGALFGFRSGTLGIDQMVLMVVETENHQTWALAVDRIYDQRQVVIKGLEGNYGHIQGIAAATILGDGNIALIIDPEEVSAAAQSRPERRPAVLEEMRVQ